MGTSMSATRYSSIPKNIRWLFERLPGFSAQLEALYFAFVTELARVLKPRTTLHWVFLKDIADIQCESLFIRQLQANFVARHHEYFEPGSATLVASEFPRIVEIYAQLSHLAALVEARRDREMRLIERWQPTTLQVLPASRPHAGATRKKHKLKTVRRKTLAIQNSAKVEPS